MTWSITDDISIPTQKIQLRLLYDIFTLLTVWYIYFAYCMIYLLRLLYDILTPLTVW